MELEHSIPLFPQGHGAIEVQHKGILKYIQIYRLDNSQRNISIKEWRQAIDRYVYAYNQTPSSVTGIAPLELMRGQPVRGWLPESKETFERTTDYANVREMDWKK